VCHRRRVKGAGGFNSFCHLSLNFISAKVTKNIEAIEFYSFSAKPK